MRRRRPRRVAAARRLGRARRSPRCRRRSRPRCSLPWCRCSGRPRAASRARCASARRRSTSTIGAAVEEADRSRGHGCAGRWREPAQADPHAIPACEPRLRPTTVHALRARARALRHRRALRGDLLDFAPTPAWGDADSPAVRFRPDHWLLIEDGRIVAVPGAQAPGDDWPRARPPRPPAPARLHRHPRAQPAARRDRQLRHRAARLARRRYTFPAEARHADAAHAAGAAAHFPRRAAGARHDGGGGLPDRARRARSTRCSPRRSGAACALIAGKVLMDRHAPDDLRDDVATGRARDASADRALARPRPAGLRGDGALRADQHAAAAGDGRRAAAAPTRASTCRPTSPRTAPRCAWVRELFPEARSYLDVYAAAGLLARAQRARARHLARRRRSRARCADSGAQIAHSPSSNLFLGSGLFDWRAADGGAASRSAWPATSAAAPACRCCARWPTPTRCRRCAGERLTRLEGAARGDARRGAGARSRRRDRHARAGRMADVCVWDWAVGPVATRRACAWRATCMSGSSPG